jgi:hypothetical protein
MMRFHRFAILFVVVLGLGAAGCRQDNGERCEQGSDCASGYCGGIPGALGTTSAKGSVCTPDSNTGGSTNPSDASTTSDVGATLDASDASEAGDAGAFADAGDAKPDASDAAAVDGSDAGAADAADGAAAETGGDASGSDGAVDAADAGVGG